MEELREIAKAHYRGGSAEVQALAYEFFKSLDLNDDGRVQLHEFLAFMKQDGPSCMHNPHFFNELDRDRNGTLEFAEVMTLFYIIKSGRPFCDWCGQFIPGIFFSCVECFEIRKGSFTLCLDCYKSKNCDHNHNGRVQFLDNYTLLESKKPSAVAPATGSNQIQPNNPVTPQSTIQESAGTMVPAPAPAPAVSVNTHSYVTNPPSPRPSTSNAIVPATPAMKKWQVALRAFEVALAIGNIAATSCTIL